MDNLTIKEAAAALNVSTKTVRRWIKEGKLEATMIPTVRGLQYQVSSLDIRTANQVLDVVKLEHPTDPQMLALAVAKAVHEAQAPLIERLEALQRGMDTLLSTVDKPVKRGHRGWWRFWKSNARDEASSTYQRG